MAANRSVMIRQTYRELRASLPGNVNGAEILRAAAALVALIHPKKSNRRPRLVVVEPVMPTPVLDTMPLHEVFEDHGWDVLCNESVWVDDLYDDETWQAPLHEPTLRSAA